MYLELQREAESNWYHCRQSDLSEAKQPARHSFRLEPCLLEMVLMKGHLEPIQLTKLRFTTWATGLTLLGQQCL